jgi:Pyruvate/2-oxoacid:ferredoxin oxidoreductase delta subunit
MFARLLVLIYKSLKPSFTVLDGILAMEGPGPGRGGMPREIGVLMGSNDALTLDETVCRMLAIKPEELLIWKVARDMGLTEMDTVIDGELPVIRDFRFPVAGSLIFGPKFLHRTMRRHFVRRPESDERMCALCGECWKYCPAKAIERKESKLAFDYDKCIRCYCCIEVCPHGALSAVDTVPGKLLRKIMKR